MLGVLTGLVVPIAVFIWLYHEEKGKREAVIEIAKHLDDPAKVERLLGLFDERKKAPIDYRRGGVITLFVGLGIYLLGAVSLGPCLRESDFGRRHRFRHDDRGLPLPQHGEELTDAVEEFEKR